MTVGLRGSPGGFFRHLQQLEQAGVEFFWAGEAYTADAVSTLGFIAAATERAQIGSSILPLYTRTPSLLAMTAVGLDQLS
ncbi:MAG TPA: LLM class flavin-dependent oxidoreductase, partial [Mycobacteriales bacterium]|nr:LLM class flavin-dependent oxidoreductase [Mycobacteriales bacterium]